MVNARKKRHGTIQVTDPNLGGARVEIECAFFVDFASGIGGGKDFDTDLRGANEDGRFWLILDFKPVRAQPSHIDSLDAVSSRERALCNDETLRKQLGQKIAQGKLSAPVAESWQGSHEDMPVSIGLDSIRQLRQPGIRAEFSPTNQIKTGLRLEIRELDRDRHAGKIRQN